MDLYSMAIAKALNYADRYTCTPLVPGLLSRFAEPAGLL